MTVPSSTARVSYAANGVTVAFAVPFRFLADTHLRVTERLPSGTEAIVSPASYTVAGAGAPSGGTVTFGVAPASGLTIVIIRNVPLTQETDYVENDPFPADSHENALDKLCMVDQQQQDEINLSIKLPTTTSGVSSRLPAPVGLGVWGWNEAGDAPRYFDAGDLGTVANYGNWTYNTLTAVGGETTMTLTGDPVTLGNLNVSIDGVVQVPGVDFTLSSSTITFTTPLVAGQVVLARYGTAVAVGFANGSAISWAEGDEIKFLSAGGVDLGGIVHEATDADLAPVLVLGDSYFDIAAQQGGAINAQFFIDKDAVNYLQFVAAQAGGVLSIGAVGSDANIDISIITKGSGVVRFGAFTSNADAPVTGYITIKDRLGNVRKLATIA